jgi:hypothetical protein
MANAPVLKTGGRKALGVRIPRPPLNLRDEKSRDRWRRRARAWMSRYASPMQHRASWPRQAGRVSAAMNGGVHDRARPWRRRATRRIVGSPASATRKSMGRCSLLIGV